MQMVKQPVSLLPWEHIIRLLQRIEAKMKQAAHHRVRDG
jgi:hypothetical protein